MEIRPLESDNITVGWRINEEGLPGTGKISEDEFNDLMELSEFCLGAFDGSELLGFVLCLLPNTSYQSLNYAWFQEKYDEFLYVDRIAVSQKHRNRGVGTQLYQCVFNYAEQLNYPVVAEVNLTPPNLDSERFHLRHGFKVAGVFHSETKSVTMFLRPMSLPE